MCNCVYWTGLDWTRCYCKVCMYVRGESSFPQEEGGSFVMMEYSFFLFLFLFFALSPSSLLIYFVVGSFGLG